MRSKLDVNLNQGLLEANAARAREKEREAPDEIWTLVVAQTLVERMPPRPGEDADDAALVRSVADSSAPGASAELSAPERGTGAEGPAASQEGARDASGVPATLSAEVSDERFGRLHLHVARAATGLDIVINVADGRVKALIEAEQAMLVKTLKDAGLRVASVQIGSTPRAGTALALEGRGPEKARSTASWLQPGAKRRAYTGPLEEEDDDDSEGVDFTA
jgi:hypothetical protein